MPSTPNSWRQNLPSVYHWAGSVRITSDQTPPTASRVVVPVKFEGDPKPLRTILAKSLDSSLVQELLQSWEKSGWQGKGCLPISLTGQTFLLVPVSSTKVTPVQISRQFGIDTAKALSQFNSGSVCFAQTSDLESSDVLEGLALGFYDISSLFKGAILTGKESLAKKLENFPESLSFQNWSAGGKSIDHARHRAQSAALMRMLQDAPANWLTPEKFAQIAQDVSADLGIKCTVLGRPELEKLGAGSMLSVTAGSAQEPRLFAMEVKGKNPAKTIALIGKGLTFDSGGISLKPGLGMGEMKYDMSGGATVLAAAHYLAKEQPPCNVVAIVGAVENMPGPNATKPGDVVVAMNGKSIDILNTDAEGRLVLADLLHYANTTYKPEVMINVATLTGAVLHALGHVCAAVMGNNQPLVDQLLATSRETGEPLWQLPLFPEHCKEVKGDCSDYANIAKPNVQAGSIMGGAFLAEFVGTTKWAHLDVAGTSWSCAATGYPSSGGSSFGLRVLTEYCLRHGS